MKIAAVTSGVNDPARRYRVEQLVAPLGLRGIELEEYFPRISSYPPRDRIGRPLWLLRALVERVGMLRQLGEHDAVVFQRELVSTLPTLERWFRAPSLLDVDDAIHLYRGGWAARSIASSCEGVICGNRYLAEWYSAWNRNVAVIPTGVDVEAYTVARGPDSYTFHNQGIIGWIGSPGNLKYLSAIAAPLVRVLRNVVNAKLEIITSEGASVPSVLKPWADVVPWRPGIEYERVHAWRMGLMPLTDGSWERGKCAFKFLQYLAAGVPAVVSPVGMNQEVLEKAPVGLAARTEREWYEAVAGLLMDPHEAFRMGATGRKLVCREYALDRVADLWAQALRRWL